MCVDWPDIGVRLAVQHIDPWPRPRQSLPQVAVYFLATVLSSALAGGLVAHGHLVFRERSEQRGNGIEKWQPIRYDKVDSMVRTTRVLVGSILWVWANHAMCCWREWKIHFPLQSVFQQTHEGNMPRNGPLEGQCCVGSKGVARTQNKSMASW